MPFNDKDDNDNDGVPEWVYWSIVFCLVLLAAWHFYKGYCITHGL